MSLISLVVVLIVFGVVLALVPMNATIRNIIIAIILIIAILWIFSSLGYISGPNFK